MIHTSEFTGNRTADRASAVRWARQALVDERVVILDTETTDLHGYICDLAIIRGGDGTVLLDSLVNPCVPIAPAAQAIHGIGDVQVAAAPMFRELVGPIYDALRTRRVLVYNAAFDAGRFDAELSRMGSAVRAADMGRWECIMLQHAAFVGAWNEHHGNYRWHKLTGGDHRALGDCRAARARLQFMAAG